MIIIGARYSYILPHIVGDDMKMTRYGAFAKPKKKRSRKPFERDIPENYEKHWKDNPAFQLLLNRYKSGAYRRHLEFSLTDSRFQELTEGSCHYCGTKPYRYVISGNDTYVYNGVDRMDSAKGYVIGNVVSCCAECNMMKNDTHYNDFMERIESIYLRLCT